MDKIFETNNGYSLTCNQIPLDNRFPKRVYVLAKSRLDFELAFGKDVADKFVNTFYSDEFDDGIEVCGIKFKTVFVKKCY
jgi:hypothetical protein